MQSVFGSIAGNSTLKERLVRDICDNTLSHAYIIEGPRGSGKHTLSRAISAAISCKNRARGKDLPCGVCRNCEKILSGTSPDIIYVSLEEDKVTIGVDSVRKIKNDIYTAPNDLDIKVYIIEDADKMTVQAQNAFLLSLEEPPNYVMFFLLCESSSSLLETVRSRAPVLRLERLSRDEVEEHIVKNYKQAASLKESSPKEFQTTVFSCGGCIGRAIELLDAKARKELIEQRSLALNIISMLSRSNASSAVDLISSLKIKRPAVIRILLLLESALRDLILLKKSDSAALCFFDDPDEASELSTHFTSATLLSLYDSAEQTITDLEANANVRLALLNMMQRAGLI